MKEITLPLASDLGTRKLIGREGGSPELPTLVLGDKLTCQLRLYEKTEGELRERVPNVRTLRASLGKTLEPATGGTFRLRLGADAPAVATIPEQAILFLRRIVVETTADDIFNASVWGRYFVTLDESIAAIRALDPSEQNFRVTRNAGEVRVEVLSGGAHVLQIEAEDLDNATLTQNANGENAPRTPPLLFNATAANMLAALAGTPAVTVESPAPSTWLVKTSRLASEAAWCPDVWQNNFTPHSFIRLRAFTLAEVWWFEVRTIQTPLAFSGLHERVLPAPPSVREIQEGGSGSANEDIEVNEIQALTLPSDFRGTYVLAWNFRQTALLGIEDGPEQIEAALNAMWRDGKKRFKVNNPEADAAYIEFIGELADQPWPFIVPVVKTNEPGVLTFTLDLATAELAAALRAVAEIKVPLEVELEVVPDGAAPEVPGKTITVFQHVVTVAREQICPELATVPAIDWLRPPQPKNYVPFTPDQIITGQQHFVAVRGDGATTSFPLDHGLATLAFSSILVRENSANGRELVNGEDYQVGFTSADSMLVEMLGPYPASVNALLFIATAAGPKSAFQAHTHTIAQIVGLQDLLDTIGARLSAIEDLLPTVTPTQRTLSAEAQEIELPDRTEIFPGRFAADFNPEDAAKSGKGLPRPPGLLPAIHDATITALATLPLPSASANEGQVFQNNTGASLLMPGGLGRRSANIPAGGFFGSDARLLYRLTREVATNSFFPADFERELFTLHINDRMLRAGQIFSVEFALSLALLKATTKGQILLLIEVGNAPSQGAPAPTGENLEDVTWNPTPLLSQRLVLTDLLLAHKFGAAIKRDALGSLTADRLFYGQWEGSAQAPAGPNFTLRARLVNFDTENSATNERGFVFYKFHDAKAAIT